MAPQPLQHRYLFLYLKKWEDDLTAVQAPLKVGPGLLAKFKLTISLSLKNKNDNIGKTYSGD